MINLPKPSPLNFRGSVNDKFNYLIHYLTTLVSDIEKVLGSIKDTGGGEGKKTVEDITLTQGKLNIIYSDGSIKHVTIEN